MPRKRSLEPTSPPQTPRHPRKRRQLHNTGSTSSPERSYTQSSPESAPSSSYTRFSHTYSVPSDSPTNPFGLERSKDVFLPESTSFGRHAALRFQVVCPKEDVPLPLRRRPFSRTKPSTATPAFRIIQVPRSYSFRLLHTVIHYFFSASAAPTSKTKYPSGPPSGNIPPATSSHRFDVLTNVEYAEEGIGIIKSGHVIAQLNEDSQNEASILDRELPEDPLDDPKEGQWSWWDEEYSLLSLIWPGFRVCTERAIIYRPDPDGYPELAIHISINTVAIRAQKGNGNLPRIHALDGFIPRSLSSLLGPPPKLPPLKPKKGGGPVRTAVPIPTDPYKSWNDPGVFERFMEAMNRRFRLCQRELAASERGSPSPGSVLGEQSDSDYDDGLEVPIASSPVRHSSVLRGRSPFQNAVRRRRSEPNLQDDDTDSDIESVRSTTHSRARSLSADWAYTYDHVPTFTPAPPPNSVMDRRLRTTNSRLQLKAQLLDDDEEEKEQKRAKRAKQKAQGQKHERLSDDDEDNIETESDLSFDGEKPLLVKGEASQQIFALAHAVGAPNRTQLAKQPSRLNGVGVFPSLRELGMSPKKTERVSQRAASEEV